VAILMVVSVIAGCAVKEKVIGIAWRADTDSEFYTNATEAIRKAGAKPVLLGQVFANYLTYDESGKLVGCTDEVGSMTIEAADKIKTNLWENTNVEEVMNGIDAVIFTGGEDISSSLFRTPEPWHGIEAEIDYNATSDASDYILMSYCIEKDIATVGFCRGMQMLAVVSGATMIQDIPTHFEVLGLDYRFEHRNEKATSESYRDYAAHDVKLASGSLASSIYNTDVLYGCPSWHHQAVLSVEGTELIVSGTTSTNTEDMMEIIEYKGKGFIIGFQFHPEAAAVKQMSNAENASNFMGLETSMLVFEALLEHIK
jgi:putative glutamine amidotransferase